MGEACFVVDLRIWKEKENGYDIQGGNASRLSKVDLLRLLSVSNQSSGTVLPDRPFSTACHRYAFLQFRGKVRVQLLVEICLQHAFQKQGFQLLCGGCV